MGGNLLERGLRPPGRRRSLLAVPVVYFFFYMVYFSLLQEYALPKFWVSCELDAMIPFCELFVIPYILWFPLVPGLYLFFYKKNDIDSYLYLCRVMLTGLTICLLIYTFFPNGQLLRRPMPRDNILCQMVGLIRKVDPPINVCPSIHAFVSASVAMAASRARSLSPHPRVRVAIITISVLICLSTVFLKQHSIIDTVLGVALTFLLDALALRGWLTLRPSAFPLFRRRRSVNS